jgi:hypothetical protein
MAAYDGSIRINTKVDTEGVKTGLSSITSGLKSFASTVGLAFGVAAVINFGKECINVASDLNEVQNVVDTTFGKSEGKIEDFASTSATQFGLSTLAAKQYTGTIGAMFKSMGFTTDAAADMSTKIAGLSGDLASFYNLSTDEAFEKLRSGISGETEPLKQLGINLSEANLSAYALKEGVTKAYDKLSEQQKALIRYNYILSVTKDSQGDFAKTSNSWANQVRILSLNFDTLKATLGKAFIAVLTPVLQTVNQLVSGLTYAASIFTDFVGILTGTTDAANSTSSAISGLTDTTKDNTAATTDGSAATEEASDNLASFDKINTLSSDKKSDSGTDGTGGLASTVGKIGKSSGSEDNSLVSKIKGSMDAITKILTASAGLLVIGAILTFTGHPLLGIALMAVGAIGLAAMITVNGNAVKALLQGPMGEITALVSGALLAVGAILAFSGVNIPLGIALMAIGAAGLATVVVANWESIQTALQGPLGELNTLIGGTLLVLGAILAFSGVNVPLGIALMATGAIGLTAEIAVNWDTIKTALQGPVGDITELVSGALLVLGAVIAFSGANVPLGIAMMAAGTVGLAAAIIVNWNSLDKPISDTISNIDAMVSTGFLALGAILAMSGANIPLGIALMAVGAIGLAATVAINWNSTSDSIRNTLTTITANVGISFLALGAMLAFSGVNIPLGIALLSIGAISLATAVELNWESIVTALQGPIGETTALVSVSLLALGALLCFSGVGIPLGIALIASGAAGLATVVAVNWNSMVTALQGPIGQTTAITGAALLALGAILCLSGVGIPLGIGLLAAGGVSLAAAIAPNWNAITDKVKNVWTDIEKGTTDFINWMIGGIEWMVNKILDGINWMINELNKVSFSIPDWVPKIGGKSFGFHVSTLSPVTIPRLAQGAVIPPNRQFMAILGDQTSGTNIETPLSTMTDAFKAALSGMNISGSSSSPVNIIASADSAGLVKYFKFEIQKEDNRIGTKLVTGGERY